MSKRITRAAFSALVLVVSTACPKGPPHPSADRARSHVEDPAAELVGRTRALLRQQDEALWQSWTEGPPVDLRATADEEAALYTRKAIARIDEAFQDARDPLDRRALEQLRIHFAGEVLSRAVARETHALAAAEASLALRSGEQQHALRDLNRVLARERNALTRQETYGSAAKLVEGLTPLIEARQQRIAASLPELGYATRKEFASILRRANLDQIALDARQILDVTEPAFRNVLQQLAARELRLPLERVRLRDLPRMFRSRGVDELFPKEAISERVLSTVRGLGAEPSTLSNLKVDERDLPGKNARALALAVEIPADVRLSVKPLAGLRAQSAYLHEMGYALYAAFTREPRFALTKLGPAGVSEAWSRVFELLVQDPVWLERLAKFTGERRDRYLAASAAWDLYRLRRAAARVLYEQALEGGAADPKSTFREMMGRAFLVPMEESDTARWLMEQDEFFASAGELQAEMLAHQLQGQLKARFGPAWWEKREAGEYLRLLWAHGNALDAEELAQAAGVPRLSADALVLRLTGALKVPIALSEARDETE
jgi:hypothetical protein